MQLQARRRCLSQPVENATLRVISLGAGVQSYVMALMAAKGEIGPMPDVAIFADTQAEPESVYVHLDWLKAELPFPLYVVTAGSLGEYAARGINLSGEPFDVVPFYTPGHGLGQRACTVHFKIKPIGREVRRLCGVGYKQRMPAGVWVEQWMGISRDELSRVKRSRHTWCVHRWPLLELQMSRHDCQVWFARHYPGRVLPRSACVFCPFHSQADWRRLRDRESGAWREAVRLDAAIRHASAKPASTKGEPAKREQYVHRSCVPLEAADLDNPHPDQLSFLDECDGMCGV